MRPQRVQYDYTLLQFWTFEGRQHLFLFVISVKMPIYCIFTAQMGNFSQFYEWTLNTLANNSWDKLVKRIYFAENERN